MNGVPRRDRRDEGEEYAVLLELNRDGADANFYTAGGRVLDVTAVAPTLAEARRNAYAVARTVDWEGRQMRRDIAAAAAAGRQDDR